MNTIFYDQQYRRPFPVTLLMVERIETLNERGELDFATLLPEFVEVPAGSLDEYVEYVLERFRQRQTEAKPQRRLPQSKSLGHVVATMCAGMSMQDMLILAFGIKEARRLYCEEDMDDALLALRMWHTNQINQHRMAWESSLYAYGGRYNGDNGQNQNMEVIDMEAEDGSGFNALRDFAKQINGVFH